MDIDPHRIAAHPLTAGLAGAVVGLRFAPGLSWVERIANVFAGSMCAGFVGPATSEMFNLTSNSMQSALAFAIGMFGMSIAAAIFQALRDIKLTEIITDWLSRNKGR